MAQNATLWRRPLVLRSIGWRRQTKPHQAVSTCSSYPCTPVDHRCHPEMKRHFFFKLPPNFTPRVHTLQAPLAGVEVQRLVFFMLEPKVSEHIAFEMTMVWSTLRYWLGTESVCFKIYNLIKGGSKIFKII
jgi:hypothetical protein